MGNAQSRGIPGLGSAGLGLSDWIKKHPDWRDQEYNKLRSLHAGYTLKKFRSELGQPVFDRRSRNGRFREQTYKRREHWVQTVSDNNGSVVLYSVTACGDKFKQCVIGPGLRTRTFAPS